MGYLSQLIPIQVGPKNPLGWRENHIIDADINTNGARHCHESRNPERHWIPGQARNDKQQKIYVVVYKIE